MDHKPYTKFFLLITVFALALSACGAPEAAVPTVDMNELIKNVAATIQGGYTQTALAMPTATITKTPEPTITPLPSVTLQPLVVMTPTLPIPPTPTGPTPLPINPATANGCYNAALVADVTVPAGTSFKTGATFTKTWRVVNTGTCDWTGEFKITYTSGSMFGADTTKIRQRVPVGGIADISLNMEAPSNSSGTVVSNWQLATDAGSLFGPVLSASIILPGSNPTATSVGCYTSALVSETIPSGSKLSPGERFVKTWQIKNTGTCDWDREFMFMYAGGYDFSGADSTRIREKVTPGGTVTISMSIDAPTDPETYSSSWQLVTSDGASFGQVFTINIVVK